VTLVQLAATAACLVLAGLAVLQLLLAIGQPLGRLAWGGQHDVLPRNLRIGSVVAIALYAVFALVLLVRPGMVPVLPAGVAAIAAWVVAALSVLAIGANAASRSRPERLTMTPVAAVLALCSIIVAWG